jgi:alcohol dehydrogenase YqhD (iron-dependent ADH family)
LARHRVAHDQVDVLQPGKSSRDLAFLPPGCRGDLTEPQSLAGVIDGRRKGEKQVEIASKTGGYPLGARHDIAHGVALSLALGECLRFNRAVRLERIAVLAESLGVARSTGLTEPNADASIDAMEALADDVQMPISLSTYNVGVRQLQTLAEDAIADVVMANTPRPPTTSDVKAILTAVL